MVCKRLHKVNKFLQPETVYGVPICMNSNERSSTTAALPLYTTGEEIANSILHGIGTVLAIAGLCLLILKTMGFIGGKGADMLAVVATVIFAVTMIGMFLTSTLYHAIQHQGAKLILRRLDHSVIYVFIAGTYTPLCLIGIGGAWGWSIFGVQWTLALCGIIFNILDRQAFKKAKVAAYLLMGWVIVVGFVPFIRSVSMEIVILTFAGGVAYSLGTIWYRKKNLRFNHAIWHFFVIIGAACHWFAIWLLI